MRKILHKTSRMKTIENKFNLNVEELLRQKYVDENKSTLQIAEELNISHVTVIKWLSLAGIYSHRLKIIEKG